MFLDATARLLQTSTCLMLATVALAGSGFWIVRLFGAAVLPIYWTFPLSLVLGEALLSLTVQAMLFAGADTGLGLPCRIGIAAVVLGAAGGLVWIRLLRQPAPYRISPDQRFLLAFIAFSLLANFAISAAPSEKIDELYYHMLLPKRIVGMKMQILSLANGAGLPRKCIIKSCSASAMLCTCRISGTS